MTEKGYRIVTDINKDGWETSSFPILCETCLGNNPYVRMSKADFDEECKICTRPCTVFRWRPGSKARYKQTVVCQTCAKLKNVCQTCLFDLEYGLPVQVRDKFLEDQQRVNLPQSAVNRDYYTANIDSVDQELAYGKMPAHPILSRMARVTPYYKRNMARICSFFVKGECTRGDECPFRHEMPEKNELSHQNIRDRFFGENDPVANKLLRKVDSTANANPPDDKSITTLYIGGLDARIMESDIRDNFYVFGEIKSLKMAPKSNCAFVTFMDRKASENAAESLAGSLAIKGLMLRVLWGKPPGTQMIGDAYSQGVPLPPHMAPVGPAVGAKMYYPSMDPRALGNAPLMQARTADER
eukprot:Platyproteum_vivax@DN2503_c0_g1_i1.p1